MRWSSEASDPLPPPGNGALLSTPHQPLALLPRLWAAAPGPPTGTRLTSSPEGRPRAYLPAGRPPFQQEAETVAGSLVVLEPLAQAPVVILHQPPVQDHLQLAWGRSL